MTARYIENLEEIKTKLDPHAVLEFIQPGIKKKASGQELRSPCPVHGGGGAENFSLNLNTHNWICHSNQCKGTNLIDLYAQSKKVKINEAAKELAEQFGIEIRYKESGESIQNNKYKQEDVLKCWEEAKLQGNDTYFSKKGLKVPPIARFGKNPKGYQATLIPLKNIEGSLKGIISLGSRGKYNFGEPKEAFALLGEIHPEGEFYAGEGIATVQTAWEATQRNIPAVSCGTWSNILPVVAAIKRKYPNSRPIILIDCDEGEKGLIAAQMVAKAFPDATFRKPSFDSFSYSGEEKPADFNDIISKCGQSWDIARERLEKEFDIQDWISKQKPSTEQPKVSTDKTRDLGRCEPAGEAIKRIQFMEGIKDKILKYRKTGISKISGLSTGFNQLDEWLDGLQGGHLILLAGRTGMGKTFAALNLLKNLAILQSIPSALFSLEMSHKQIFLRLASLCSGVNATKIRRGEINDEELAKLEQALKCIEDSPLFVSDDSANSDSNNLYHNMMTAQKEGVKSIFIDHIGLVKCGQNYKETRATELGEISMKFKLMAKQYDLPIICLAQLNREADSKDPPKLSQLRESGNLEQNADIVIFIHRRDYYDKLDKPEQVELIIRKNRDGEEGQITFTRKKENWLLSELLPIKNFFETVNSKEKMYDDSGNEIICKL